jgi:OOP family OmpA-OmpF porin
MRGVDPSRITSSGKGRNQPVTAAGACDRLKKKALRSCLAPDRRVEIEAIATVTETVKPK